MITRGLGTLLDLGRDANIACEPIRRIESQELHGTVGGHQYPPASGSTAAVDPTITMLRGPLRLSSLPDSLVLAFFLLHSLSLHRHAELLRPCESLVALLLWYFES